MVNKNITVRKQEAKVMVLIVLVIGIIFGVSINTIFYDNEQEPQPLVIPELTNTEIMCYRTALTDEVPSLMEHTTDTFKEYYKQECTAFLREVNSN